MVGRHERYDKYGRTHIVTVFALHSGGRSAWCSCGERFDANDPHFVVSWANAHGGEVHHHPSTGDHAGSDSLSA
ncbi:MAG: hypothetical protein ACYDA2_09580 [Acidimicrobiales bacterium]